MSTTPITKVTTKIITDHKTNLMIACEKGTPEIVEILLTN